MKDLGLKEKKTDIRGLLKAFFAPDEQGNQEVDEETREFNDENREQLSIMDREVESLEKMLYHPDVKVEAKSKKRRQSRNQTRITGKGAIVSHEEKTVDREEESEIER